MDWKRWLALALLGTILQWPDLPDRAALAQEPGEVRREAILDVVRRNLEAARRETREGADLRRVVIGLRRASKALEAYDGDDRRVWLDELRELASEAAAKARGGAASSQAEPEVLRELEDILRATGEGRDAADESGSRPATRSGGPAVGGVGKDASEPFRPGTAGDETIARAPGVPGGSAPRADGPAAQAPAARPLEAAVRRAAEQVWPVFVQSYGPFEPLDPAACLRDVAACKGKLVRFEGAADALASDWNTEPYDWLVELDGAPVAGRFDAGLAEAVRQLEQATGLRYALSGPIEDVVGVVESICKVERVELDPATGQPAPATAVDAPCLRIVAMKAGPFAVSLGHGTSLSPLEGVPPVEASEAGTMRVP